jgi:hypothetical protein
LDAYGASKYKQQSYIPNQLKPKELFFSATSKSIDELAVLLQEGQITYPLIIKPDFAERGVGVRLIENEQELGDYLTKGLEGEFIIQEYINEQLEFGVFYVKMPKESKGKVVSIVQKEFMHVIGNGKETVLELLEKNQRALLSLDKLKSFYPELMKTVPQQNDKVLIEPIGNHNRGTKFLDRNDLISNEVSSVFDEICGHLPNFFYGRLDIKAKDELNLSTGHEIKVFEVNGANAEPAHIYDPKHSFWYAQSVLFKHWYMMAKIAAANKNTASDLVKYKTLMAAFKQRNLLVETIKN